MTDDYARNQRYCRSCKRLYMQEYRNRNRDRVNATNRASHARNAERRRAQQRAYRERKKVMPDQE